MPQMSPMMWLNMYMYFSILFFITIMIIYFSFNYIPSQKFTQLTFKSLNWKW
nr:ATP synthase F0 subunit 8 [Hylurgus micklitzi]